VPDTDLAAARLIAAEFGLGKLASVTPLGGGGPDVRKLTTAAGLFVIKPAASAADAELYERVARALSAAGVRQAMPRRSLTGALVSVSGHTVQEFLAGRACPAPTAAQATATMRHIAACHVVLRQVPSPAAVRAGDSLWCRVASAGYLVRELPALLAGSRPGPGPERSPGTDNAVAAALGQVTSSLSRIQRLPSQLAIAAEQPSAGPPARPLAIGPRYEAVRSVMRSWAALPGLTPRQPAR
jgi:hypothetical protein